jgi:hypothetical protein
LAETAQAEKAFNTTGTAGNGRIYGATRKLITHPPPLPFFNPKNPVTSFEKNLKIITTSILPTTYRQFLASKNTLRRTVRLSASKYF